MAADSEISLLTRGSTPSKATRKTWSSPPAEEEEDGDEEVEKPSVKFMPPQPRCLESDSSSIHEVTAESRPSASAQAQLSLSFDTSQTSVRSTDTTLEYYDAPLSEEQEGEEGHLDKDEEVVTMNIKILTEKEEPEEKPSPTTEQTPLLTAEDLEREEEEEAKEEEMFEVMETGLEQVAKNEEEEVQCEKADEQDFELSSKQEDAATLEQEDTSSHNQGNSFAEFALLVIGGGLLHATEPIYKDKCSALVLQNVT